MSPASRSAQVGAFEVDPQRNRSVLGEVFCRALFPARLNMLTNPFDCSSEVGPGTCNCGGAVSCDSLLKKIFFECYELTFFTVHEVDAERSMKM